MKNKGITLVALVVTIIILLILAGVAITSLTNTDLFENAKQAKTAMENAENIENATLSSYEKKIENYSTENEIKLKNVDENANIILSTTENIKLQDKYGNKIIIPAGFKIVVNDNTNNATTVDKGIVIEDATSTATAGSQFVWIPVGKITKADGTTVEINLDRYTFDGNGIPTPQGENVVETYFSETASKGNTVAKSITNFKKSVTTNGGYYIGRYEARTTTARNSKDDTLTQITEKGTDQVYNYVTQIQAASQAQKMYDNTHPYTSDLMNSYAWDTAIVFLQKCGDNPTYSRKTSVNSSFATTGTNNQTTKDVQCNVFDMAGNVIEWTTETSSNSSEPCVYRGGHYRNSTLYTSDRYDNSTSGSDVTFGFRTLLYL